jgi:hypothetical protein
VTLVGSKALAITNSFYSGTDTNGVLLSQFGGIASGATYLTNAFDALAVGWRATTNTSATAIDINRIAVNRGLAQSPVSLTPINLAFQVTGSQLLLSWPADRQGWRLEIQTNSLTGSLGTNWVTVPGSTNVNALSIVIDPENGSVFLRLVYP